MKIKEKLAAQYLGSLISEGGLSSREMQIFEAGFEKARAIAYDLVEPYDCDIHDEIRWMGEEEVENG